MPKSGTSSLNAYFTCNQARTAHWKCKDNQYCGVCMQNFFSNVAKNTWKNRKSSGDYAPELQQACGNYNVYAQLDFQTPLACLYPQVNHLQTLVRALPHACFTYTDRPFDHWLASVKGWGGSGSSNMYSRFLNACEIYPRNETGLFAWRENHKRLVRETLRGRCFLEIEIEEPDAGARVAEFFQGTRASCWGQKNCKTSCPKG
jgi:hypothetical protein